MIARRRDRALSAAVMLGVLAISACSSSDSSPGTPPGAEDNPAIVGDEPAGEPAPGQVHGESSSSPPFRAFVHVTATASPNVHKADVPVVIEVQLAHDGEPIVGAEVTGGPVGKPVHATPSGVGRYQIELVGYAPWYEVSIASGGTVLDGVRLRAPAFHEVVVPSKPKKNQATTIRWTPNHEDAINSVDLRVLGQDPGTVLYDEYVADTGEVQLPDTVVPANTSFSVEVRRSTMMPLALADSAGIVDLTVGTGAIAP